MLRTFIIAGALAAAAILPSAASATVVVSDESRAHVHVMDQLEQGLRARFGPSPVDAARDAYGFIWVGRSTASPLPAGDRGERPHPAPPARQPMLLMKDVTGWYGWHTGRKAKLARPVAQELDAILTGEAVWAERTSLLGACRGSARILYARHAGRDLVRRECGSTGLAARLAEIAATGRASGKPLPQARADDRKSAFGVDRRLFRHIFDRSDLMAASWERGDLAGYLEPYAEDVVVVRPGRTIRGREALIAAARREREWRPGAAPAIRLHSTSLSPQVGDTIRLTREYRLQKDGREMKRIVISHWQNRGGLWQILREEVGADTPA
jgi:hypothetical protein